VIIVALLGATVVVMPVVVGATRRRSLRDEVHQFDASQEALGRVVRRTASRHAPVT
jgi:hypothetical protein